MKKINIYFGLILFILFFGLLFYLTSLVDNSDEDQQASILQLFRNPVRGPVQSNRSGVFSPTRGGNPQMAPCTLIDTCGKILIIKDVVPDSREVFTLNHALSGYPRPTYLDDDDTLPNPSSIPRFANFIVLPGIYNMTISPVSGFETSVACIDPSNDTVFRQNNISIRIFAGETVACIFTSKKTNMISSLPNCIDCPVVPNPPACIPNTWNRKADLPGIGRFYAVSFVIGNNIYVGTGTGAGTFIYNKDFYEYNTTTDTWTRKSDLPGAARFGSTSFASGGKGYVLTGANTTGDMWEYDPVSDAWSQKASFPGGRRFHSSSFVIGDKAYVGFGWDASNQYNDLWEYTPITNTWTQKASLPGPTRDGAVSFVIGNKGYVGTGYYYSIGSLGVYLNDFWEYDPVSDAWTQKADLPGSTRRWASGFSINNKGYIGTGSNGNSSLSDFWEYNPASNTWTQKADFPSTIRYGSVGSATSKGYITTGRSSGQNNNDHWEYCP